MDALSEVLKVVRLGSAVFFHARFTAPWCFQAPQAASVMQTLHPGAEQLILYHFVTEGRCTISMADGPPLELVAGDIVMFPHGDAHRMASEAQVAPGPPVDLPALLRRKPRMLRFGGGGQATGFICGYLECDPRLCRPILAALPSVLRVSLRGDASADWLEASIRYAVAEAGSPRPGGEGVLAKLSEVMMVETLRRHMAQLPPEQTGWLAGLRDRIVGKALSRLHESPAQGWTVESLAREAGASRSVLAERFAHFVGQTPMAYLARWRMALAANLLRGSSLSLARVAEEVGYETDAAFSRAFRREFGVPPAAWRKQQIERRPGLRLATGTEEGAVLEPKRAQAG
ncbi:AraC family transcriptional regulator [Ramlibacter tataouinensis]|uniref:AraC family transcriptional regulator n=1 Tax=Ramlibacter tataouinensis TaxID=94132 RepID=UPI0022F3A402|nr:AraC family transcriptional regulator [Ramlibacter tataouinensis]WBY02024.1 AraC family transcriptional regulator [Ramlibacter tataouinensis]